MAASVLGTNGKPLVKGMGVGHRSQRERYWELAVRALVPAGLYPESTISRSGILDSHLIVVPKRERG